MKPEERIANMTKAINQAIKVMGDRFGSTEEDVIRTIQILKISMQVVPQEKEMSIPPAATAVQT